MAEPGCGMQRVSWPPQRYVYGATAMRVGPTSRVRDGSAQSTCMFHASSSLAVVSPLSCAPPAASTMFGDPTGGTARPSRSAVFRKFTPGTMMHCSVASAPRSIMRRSTTQTCFSMTSSPVLVGVYHPSGQTAGRG